MIENFLRGHLNDDTQTNYDAIKYSYLTILIGMIHIVFMITFFSMGVYPLVIYNTFAVIFYFIFSKRLANITDFTKTYYHYLVEIVFHSMFATLFVGWNFNFMNYLIGLIPVAFYLTFSIKGFKRKLVYPISTTVIVVIAFFTMRILTYCIKPFYYQPLNGYEIFFCILNNIIGYGCTLLFSILFSVEVNSMQLVMESNQEKLEDQASYDPLTRFLNRRSMDEKLNNAHRNAIINNIPYSIIMCDIDNFKHFNDTYGHDCGDFVLQTISKIISAQVRSKDSCCRWGGEEFLILITDSKEIATEVAERIRKAIDTHDFYYEGKSLHVTITLGVSDYYTSSKIKTLIEIADKRLYKGKSNGKNQVVSE